MKKGFTLAEVLITLAIIGIVAALTIPTLVANYQNRAWNTAAAVFERKLEEALKTMNTQETLSGHQSTEDFVNELSKHIKITKICKNNDLTSCFSDKVYWGLENEEIDVANLKTASKFGQDTWYTNIVGVQFGNGTTGLIAYNQSCRQDPYSNQITGSDCLAILYDTSGYKNPNTSGKDLRANANVLKLGNSKCYASANGICFTSALFPANISLTKAECEQAKADGAAIETCYFENDYWAYAAKKCNSEGGRLPTIAEVAKIADYVYNTNGIGAKQNVSDLIMDTDKVAELGLNLSLGISNSFYIWASDESSLNGAYNRRFYANGTNFNDSYRSGNDKFAICVGD